MKLKINFSPGLLTEIFVDPPEESKFIYKNYLYCREQVYDAYLKKFVDETTYIQDSIDEVTGCILLASGLVKWLLIELLSDNIISKDDLEIIDSRDDTFQLSEVNPKDFSQLYNHVKQMDVQLRPYQVEGLKTVLSSNLGILCFPTSSGKGEIIVALAKVLQPFGQVLILVPSMASLHSTRERLNDYGIKHYQYHKIRGMSELDGVILSTPKIIHNDLFKRSSDSILNNVKYLLTNEVHHVQAKTWYEVSKELPQVVRSYGFSATPDIIKTSSIHAIKDMSPRDAMIIGTYGNIVMEVQSKDIEQYISVPETLNVVYSPKHIKKEDLFNFDWNYMKRYTNSPSRLQFVTDLVQVIHEYTSFTTITFVSFIESQGTPLYNAYPPGTACWYGGGNVINNVGLELDRESVFEAIKEKKIRNTIVTSHAREDINLPVLNVAIMLELSNKKSIKQCVGRVVRKGTPSFFINVADTMPKILSIQADKRSKFISDEYGTKSITIQNMNEFIRFFKSAESKNHIEK
jgi:hypothetical protein